MMSKATRINGYGDLKAGIICPVCNGAGYFLKNDKPTCSVKNCNYQSNTWANIRSHARESHRELYKDAARGIDYLESQKARIETGATKLSEEDKRGLERLFSQFTSTPVSPSKKPKRESASHVFEPSYRNGKQTVFCLVCTMHRDNAIHIERYKTNPPFASEGPPSHQFIAVRPGSRMCVQCGNLRDKGRHAQEDKESEDDLGAKPP